MIADELRRRVEQLGAHLGIEDDGRLYVEPVSQVPAALFAELREHKHALLRLLSGRKVIPITTLTSQDLTHSLDYVRLEVPTLTGTHLERYTYWLNMMEEAGEERELAERAAFYRTTKLPRMPG